MICFFATGVDKAEATRWLDLARPILAEAGLSVETDVCTVIVVPAVLRDYRKEKPFEVSEKTFWFPSFKALRTQGHNAELAMAKKLSKALGVVCHTMDAPVIASFDAA